MPNQQKLDKFWGKLTKAGAELQRDFANLDQQDKQVVKARIDNILKMRGIAVGADSLIGVLSNLRR